MSTTSARVLTDLLREVGLDHDADSVELVDAVGRGAALATPLKVIEAGIATLSAQAISVAALDRRAGRTPQRARIDRGDIAIALRPFPYLRVNGEVSDAWAHQISAAPCSGHMLTADGRHVYMANVVPRLRDGTLHLLGCEASREAVEAAVRSWQADDLEQAMTDAGLPLTVVRTRREWQEHPHGAHMADAPMAPVKRTDDAPPEPVPSSTRALSGLRVLDLTHVVAGPMVTRGLAEYGADVLHVGPADAELQDPAAVTNELMIGKRSLHLDLKSPSGRREIEHLVAGADVLVQSWRPGVLERLGLGVQRVAELRPGIVRLDISCFGPDGPWAGRPGFDGNALAAVGATDLEAQHGPPKLSPPGVLTDSLVGFLGVAVVNALLLARERSGGSCCAHLSLARVATWLLNLGHDAPGDATSPDLWGAPRLRAAASTDGTSLEHVEHPISYEIRPAHLTGWRPRPGSSSPSWLEHHG